MCSMIVESEDREREAAESAMEDYHVAMVVTLAWSPKGKAVEALPLTMEVVIGEEPPQDDNEVAVVCESGDKTGMRTYGEMRAYASEVVKTLGATEMYRAVCCCGWQSKLITVQRPMAVTAAWAHRMASTTLH